MMNNHNFSEIGEIIQLTIKLELNQNHQRSSNHLNTRIQYVYVMIGNAEILKC